MTDRSKPTPGEGPEDEAICDALSDPKTLAFLKDYLAIPDDALKAHVRRLVEEIRRNPKKKK